MTLKQEAAICGEYSPEALILALENLGYVALKKYNFAPNHCVYCGSDDISFMGGIHDHLYQRVECLDCGEEWTECYAFTHIEK
jgi:hypothetical protein